MLTDFLWAVSIIEEIDREQGPSPFLRSQPGETVGQPW